MGCGTEEREVVIGPVEPGFLRQGLGCAQGGNGAYAQQQSECKVPSGDCPWTLALLSLHPLEGALLGRIQTGSGRLFFLRHGPRMAIGIWECRLIWFILFLWVGYKSAVLHIDHRKPGQESWLKKEAYSFPSGSMVTVPSRETLIKSSLDSFYVSKACEVLRAVQWVFINFLW